MANKIIKTCGYANCRHNRKINTENEEFFKFGNLYFHKECYKEKSDLQLFRTRWVEHISNTVSFSYLNKVLNSLLDRGITSEYMLFTLDYVIINKYNLNYPNGFIYYLDKAQIKAAYKKKKLQELNNQKATTKLEVKPPTEDDSPKFTVKPKQRGFGTIFNDEGGV